MMDWGDVTTIENAFGSFWNTLVNLPGSEARGTADEIIEVQLINDDEILISAEGSQALYFRGLPYRSRNSSKIIDVFIQFREIVTALEIDSDLESDVFEEGDTYYEIQHSTTSIIYLDTTDGRDNVDALQGLHFDFDISPADNHPIFHAQFDPFPIDRVAVEDEYDLNVPNHSFPNFPRIPSAPIDVISLVYSIIHDHNPELLEGSHGWPSGPSHALNKLPKFPRDCFQYYPQGGKGMVADWWYLHATEDEDGIPRREVMDDRFF